MNSGKKRYSKYEKNKIVPLKVNNPPTMNYIPKPNVKKSWTEEIKDALVLPIYNNEFKPIYYGNMRADEYFCDVLLPPPALLEIANKNLLGKHNYLLLGMGVIEGGAKKNMSFRQGLQKLFDLKIENMTKMGDVAQLQAVKNKKNEALEYKYISAERISLKDFMKKYFDKGMANIVPVYIEKNNTIKPPKPGVQLKPGEKKKQDIEKFRRIMASLINSRLMMAYSVQELMPGNYNPMARLLFYEKLLLNAGSEYIAYYPALFDGQLSFGPFQFTPIAIEDLKKGFRNKYGCPNIPESLEKKWKMEDHINAAIAFALRNIDRLSIALSKKPKVMKRILEMVEELSKTPEGKEKLQIFAIGLIGAMHYKPRYTENTLISFANESEKEWKIDSKNPHIAIMRYLPTQEKNVRRYYWNSAVVFLALPTYLERVEKFHSTKTANTKLLPVGKN